MLGVVNLLWDNLKENEHEKCVDKIGKWETLGARKRGGEGERERESEEGGNDSQQCLAITSICQQPISFKKEFIFYNDFHNDSQLSPPVPNALLQIHESFTTSQNVFLNRPTAVCSGLTALFVHIGPCRIKCLALQGVLHSSTDLSFSLYLSPSLSPSLTDKVQCRIKLLWKSSLNISVH